MTVTKHTCPLCGTEHKGEIKAVRVPKTARYEGAPPKARIVIADGRRGMERGR